MKDEIVVLSKKCTKCGVEKSVEEFAKRSDCFTYRNKCKQCINIEYNERSKRKAIASIEEYKNSNDDIDWNLYKGCEKLSSYKKFAHTYRKMKNYGCYNIGEYYEVHKPISFTIDGCNIQRKVCNIDLFFNGLDKFKKTLLKNKDEFIELSGVDKNQRLIVKIRTFDGGILELSQNNYGQFVRGREVILELAKSVGIKIISPILTNDECIDFEIDEAKLLNRKISDFRKTVDSIKKFKSQVEREGDVFIGFAKVYNGNLYAKLIEKTFNKEIVIPIRSYNYNSQGFLRTREKYYSLDCNGVVFLEPFVSIFEKIQIKMRCGCIHKTSPVVAMRGAGLCNQCGKTRSLDENPNWKGGISELKTYLREKTKQWKYDSFKKYDFKCFISGERAEEVHHLYSFNRIVYEILNELGLKRFQNISEYSKVEISNIEKLFEIKHNSRLGIPLSKEVHKEFHKIYGYGDNTPEQFEEFKKKKLLELRQAVA